MNKGNAAKLKKIKPEVRDACIEVLMYSPDGTNVYGSRGVGGFRG